MAVRGVVYVFVSVLSNTGACSSCRLLMHVTVAGYSVFSTCASVRVRVCVQSFLARPRRERRVLAPSRARPRATASSSGCSG
eukprot:2570061-Pyramimonas_sp.AAC.1